MPYMPNGNARDYLQKHPDYNRFGIVGFQVNILNYYRLNSDASSSTMSPGGLYFFTHGTLFTEI